MGQANASHSDVGAGTALRGPAHPVDSISCVCVLPVQVMLASDLLWHIYGREATAAVGYDVTLRQARLQGKIDSTGKTHP